MVLCYCFDSYWPDDGILKHSHSTPIACCVSVIFQITPCLMVYNIQLGGRFSKKDAIPSFPSVEDLAA